MKSLLQLRLTGIEGLATLSCKQQSNQSGAASTIEIVIVHSTASPESGSSRKGPAAQPCHQRPNSFLPFFLALVCMLAV